jgi:hypothetical protein
MRLTTPRSTLSYRDSRRREIKVSGIVTDITSYKADGDHLAPPLVSGYSSEGAQSSRHADREWIDHGGQPAEPPSPWVAGVRPDHPVRYRPGRVTCVSERTDNSGDLRSLTGVRNRLNWAGASHAPARNDLLGSHSCCRAASGSRSLRSLRSGSACPRMTRDNSGPPRRTMISAGSSASRPGPLARVASRALTRRPGQGMAATRRIGEMQKYPGQWTDVCTDL